MKQKKKKMKCCKNENDHSVSLHPTPKELKTWRFWHIAFLWVFHEKKKYYKKFFLLTLSFE